MKYTPFHEQRFRASVNKALQSVEKLMEQNRDPHLAEDEEHNYDDKFSLAELMANTAIAAQLNCFEKLGLDWEKMKTVLYWVLEKNTVTLRFQAEDGCEFLRETQLQKEIEAVESAESEENAENDREGTSSRSKQQRQVVSTINEYHWKITMAHKILLIKGQGLEHALELQSRTGMTNIMTLGKADGSASMSAAAASNRSPPIKENTIHNPIDIPVTWFFKMIIATADSFECKFLIDRSSPKAKLSCKTPRRNEDIQSAIDAFQAIFQWSVNVQDFLKSRLEGQILGKNKADESISSANDEAKLDAIPADSIFCPIVPLMENKFKPPVNYGEASMIFDASSHRYQALDSSRRSRTLGSSSRRSLNDAADGEERESPLLSLTDIGMFLGRQIESMNETLSNLSQVFPPKQLTNIVSIAEASIVVLCRHIQQIALQFEDSIDYVEHLLKEQLVEAIGKEFQQKDFSTFMNFHTERLMKPLYAPKSFQYAIRRPGHSPEGFITIEPGLYDKTYGPIRTTVKQLSRGINGEAGGETSPSIFMPINGGVRVEITGARYLHGWLQNRFMKKNKANFQLRAEAKQFSCFVLMVGTVTSSDTFEPKHAIMLQNKDEIVMPLHTGIMPSDDEFQYMIASLSPEQQDFCRGFRAMQLVSSVFGLCIVQIKPQMEKLLHLGESTLSRETGLAQDILSLLIDYEIPSDMLAYAGPMDNNPEEKLEYVKNRVEIAMGLVEIEKKKQEELKLTRRSGIDGFIEEDDSESETKWADMSYSNIAPPLGMESISLGGKDLRIGGPALRVVPERRGSADRLPNNSTASSTQQPGYSRATGFQRESSQRSLGTAQKAMGSSSTTLVHDPEGSSVNDFTLIPKLLESKIESLDPSDALRPTVLKTGSPWKRKKQASLLSKAEETTMTVSEVVEERNRAFALIDAISKSGELPINQAEVHVVVAATHCFENGLLGTIVQDNINPIEKMERSTLLLASVMHGEPAIFDMIKHPSDVERLRKTFPVMMQNEQAKDVQ